MYEDLLNVQVLLLILTADLDHIFPKQPMAPQLSHHGEDTYSCQLPEEEHGDRTPEEKHCYFHPQSTVKQMNCNVL